MKARPCILVVDYDPSIREFIMDALIDEGFETSAASTPQMALGQLSETRPRLLLLDTNNISSDQMKLVSEYRELVGNEATVAVMSTASQIETLGKSIHADAVLSKPFNLSDLFEIVSRSGLFSQIAATS